VAVVVFGGALLSVTCTVKAKAPKTVGVPDSMPFGLSVIPEGNDPPVNVM